MNRLAIILSVFLISLCRVNAADVKLHSKGTATQLTVNGNPFIVLGGELGNSSASSPADIERIFPKLRRMNLNTVLVPVYWDLIEPEEGRFDYSLIDKTIDEARKNDLKVIFLWFGAWKNSMSCYAPDWFKKDSKTYPRARTRSGKPLEIASAFSAKVAEADAAAFTRLLSHIAETDTAGSVIILQIENEIGMLEDARDHSPLAQKEYAKGVPGVLTASLNLLNQKKSLHPQLLEKWQAAGMKQKGSWTEVFGDDIYTDEIFMAWNYGRYVEGLAQIARRIFPTMPLYVNAAMNSRGRKPGEYPSAGPLAHLKDIWHVAAPTVDILAPDLYDSGFTDWVRAYALADNPLFIPEIRCAQPNAAQAFYAVGEHNAIGLCPFAYNGRTALSETAYQAAGTAALRSLTPLVTAHLGMGTMNGFYLDADSTERILRRDGLRITARHYFTLPWDPRATDGSPWPAAGGLIVRTAPMEYIVAGSGLVLTFEPEDSGTAPEKKLGEDGFLASGSDRGAEKESRWKGKRIGLASVKEISIADDGSQKRIRTFNGDETHQGRHVRIGVDDFRILRVKLYEYE